MLQNAVAEGAKISTVNIMTFDYYLGTTENMLTDAESAATAAHGQLASLYPGLSSRALWEMIGVTQMPGIDDFGTAETFTTAQAPAFAIWAAIHGPRRDLDVGAAARQRQLPRHEGRRAAVPASPSRPGTSATYSSRSATFPKPRWP